MDVLTIKASDIKINVNGMTTCFDDFGEGNIPLIFIHGFPFDKSSWKPQMAFLRHAYRVIAYDIRGFGASTAGKEKPSIALFADDLVAFMDKMEIKKAVVCGLSMGGYILLNAVRRYPTRFKAIILADTQCVADSEEQKAKRKQIILDIEQNGLKTFADGFIKNVFTPESLTNKQEMVGRVKKTILATSPKTVTATLSALAERAEMYSSLNEIYVPTLILCGREDKVTPIEQSEILHTEIANSILHVIDKAGHLSNLEQPVEFNNHITNFISKYCPPQ